ncbi:hypothetical protein ACOMHN_004933 [Nucella lapillus]
MLYKFPLFITALDTGAPWILECAGYWGTLDTGVPWILGHPGYWGTLDTGAPWILECSGYWGTLDTGVPWILECSGYWCTLGTGAPWILECSGYWGTLDTGAPWILGHPRYWSALDTGAPWILECPGYWGTLLIGLEEDSSTARPRRNRHSRCRPAPSAESCQVVNLSDVVLTEAQTRVLSLGPKFCPTPRTYNELKLLEDVMEGNRLLRLKEFFFDDNTPN